MSPANKPSAASLPLTGFLVVLAVCLLWGGSIPTIKVSEHGIPPLMAATGRIAVATLLLFLYARIIKEPVMLPRNDFWHGVLLGVFFGFTMLFLYLGLVLTDAARGTIFYSTKPFWVAVGAHFIMTQDRLNFRKLAGLSLALIGVYLTFWGPGAAGLENDWGNLMEIAAALFFSATALYTKWLSNKEELGHYQTLFPMMLFSIPILLVSTLILERSLPIEFYLEDLLAFGYQSLGAQFVAYILWFWLIHRYPVSLVASFTFLVPLVGVILSAIFLGEPTPPALWLGLGLVAAGIILVNIPKKGPEPAQITPGVSKNTIGEEQEY
jgi:drug/metabolite transporter (DMT)-like permease